MLLLFKRLFTELDVYLELSAQSWRKVLSVFLVGLFCLGFVQGVSQALVYGPTILKSVVEVAGTAVSWWPKDQVGHWRNGQLTFTPEPTENKIIGWPMTLPEEITTHFAIYTPSEIATPDTQFTEGANSALFIISPRQFWLNQLNGNWSAPMLLTEAPGLMELPAGDYTQATFADEVGKALAEARRVTQSVLLLWPILNALGSWLSNAWFVFVEAGLVWLMTRLLGWHISWPRLLKLNALLVIPATALQYLSDWLYPDLTWSLFHITYWLMLSILFLLGSKELEKKATL